MSAKELALDKAKDRLANFDDDFAELVADALLKQVVAETAFDTAEASLTAFLISPTRDIAEGERIDLELLLRLQSNLREAETNVEQAMDEPETVRCQQPLNLPEQNTTIVQRESQLV